MTRTVARTSVRTGVRLVTGLTVALALLLSGCTTLPDSGPVHTRKDNTGEQEPEASYFVPPGPIKGDTPEGVVRGFLLAMRANPPSTSVARSFLSSRARGTWSPNKATIIYDASASEESGSDVVLRLSDAHALDARGGWVPGPPGRTRTLTMHVVAEEGFWRISNPPDALVVPTSYFSSVFVPFNLYFFDQTRRVLVPDTSYIPSGEQTATNLVRGLLQGPGPTLAGVAVSAFPERTNLDLGVVVTDSGIAEVPLGRSVLRLDPSGLSHAVAQLAATLRQVPGISRVRITVAGLPVTLPGGRTDVSVNEGEGFDPSHRILDPDPVAIREGRVVRINGGAAIPVGGPLGATGFALRSITPHPGGRVIAAVAANGRRVFVAPDRGRRDPARVRTVLDGAQDVLPAAYDGLGTLWLLDRTSAGAQIRVVTGTTSRPVRFPGITGRRISAFTATADGTMLIATLAGGANPVVLVGNISRGANGLVRRGLPARVIQVTGADFGPARDVGLIEPTTLALLTRPKDSKPRIVFLPLDGALVGETAGPPQLVPAGTSSILTSTYRGHPLQVLVGDHTLRRLSSSGAWVRSGPGKILAASYPE